MTEEVLSNKELKEKLEQEIAKSVDSRVIAEISEVKGWLKKTHESGEKVEELLIKRISETLSEQLSTGLLQLTIEKIPEQREYKDSVERREQFRVAQQKPLSMALPSLLAYVEFVVKSGFVEIRRFPVRFQLESNVEIKDAEVIIREGRIASVSFGSFVVSITLYWLKGQKPIKMGTETFTLLSLGPIVPPPYAKQGLQS